MTGDIVTPLYLQELGLRCLLTNHRTQRLLLKQQSCHNPHLETYLGEVARRLRQYKRDALANPSGMDTPKDSQDRRDRLVRELFSALINK